jgi:WD40 repeat protein
VLPVTALAVTPDGKQVISASMDHTLKVWELDSGRELRTLRGHTNFVNAVAVAPDGRRAASASTDNTVRIWDVASGRELITMAAHSDPVHAVAWSQDGKYLLSAGTDLIIQVYAMDIDLLLNLARSRVTRNLTREECNKYLHVDEVPPIQ